MKHLKIYFKNYRKECILGPLFKLLEASFELLIPIIIAKVIDIGIKQNDSNYIIRMCGVMLFLGIIGLLCSLSAQYFAAKAAVGFSTKLRLALFTHIQRLSFHELDTVGSSSLITHLTSDVNQVQSCINLVLRLLLRSPFIVFGAVIAAFTIDYKVALIFLIAVPVLSLVIFAIMITCIPLYKKVQNRLNKLLIVVRENLTGVRVLRVFNKENEEIEKFNHLNHELTKQQVLTGKISLLMNPLTYIIVNLSIIIIIKRGAIQVNEGYLSQGQVAALVNYMSQILIELIKFSNLIIATTKGIASLSRIEKVLEQGEATTVSTNTEKACSNFQTNEYALSFNHVYFRYKNSKEDTLTDINFNVKPGETIGIIGGTGSGKTSLIHLIPRFYDIHKGSIQIFGKDIYEYSPLELRSMIGIVLQRSVLFKGTIRENLLWGNKSASEADLLEAITVAQAKQFVFEKEDSLNATIEQEGRNLSGGQKQRLAIARALVKKPRILILDDSSSALDYATDVSLRKAIRETSEGTTVLIVSQRTNSIQHADKIVVLDDGMAVGIGTHEELLESCQVYQEIYYSQFPKEA